MKNIFSKFAARASQIMGSPYTFLCAVSIVLIWASLGKTFNYSTTWQLFINTMTTIVTFLMVFLIQNTQNRDSKALHLKLDELLKADKGARTGMVNIEELSDDDLSILQEEFKTLQQKYAKQLEKTGIIVHLHKEDIKISQHNPNHKD